MPNIPMVVPTPIQSAQWAQNGKVVAAQIEHEMRSSVNYCARWRVKELFSYSGDVTSIITKGSYDRWRSYCHTSPYLSHLRYRYIAAKSTGAAVNPTITVNAYDSASALLGSSISYPGSTVGAASDVPSEWIQGSGAITGATADTDVNFLVQESNARIISMTIYEWSLDPTTANGYLLQNFTAGQPIYDSHRSEIATTATNLWKRGAAHSFNFTVNNQASPITNATATAQNVLDTSVTAVSAASPGYTLEMSYRASLARASTGVPMIMQVYGKTSTAAVGSVVLVDSGGATVATCSGFSTSAGWVSSGAFNLPASRSKYDLMFTGSVAPASTVSVYAVSLYEYLA